MSDESGEKIHVRNEEGPRRSRDFCALTALNSSRATLGVVKAGLELLNCDG